MKTNHYFSKLLCSLFISILLIPTQGFSQQINVNEIESQEFLPGTIVIKVKEGIGPFDKQERSISFDISTLDEKVQKFGIEKLEKRFKHKTIAKNSGLPDLSRIYRIEFDEALNIHSVAAEFEKDPNIEYAEPIPHNRTTDVPNDSYYLDQQHLPQIMASEAWDVHKGEDGEEVIIAIVDTGVDWLHPDLTENCWQNLGEDADGDGVTLEFNDGVWERDPDDLNGIDDDENGFIDDVIGWDFHEQETLGDGSNPDPIWGADVYDHGTHCAGIAAGRTNNDLGISSISYNVKYLPLQASPGANAVDYGYDAIIYAAENGADIISNSWSSSAYSEANNEVISYVTGLGSIVLAAASNDNADVNAYPSAYVGSISVAAVNPDDTRASFSNYGAYVDIAAPGVSILSTTPNNSYESWNGTSMATPMVAGLIALLKSYQPTWTNDQLIEQVIGTADDIDALNPGYENALGSGRINAYHTLVDENVKVPQELKLEFLSYDFEDENANDILEAGETAMLSFSMRNFAQLVSDENATFTITSGDPDITIINASGTGVIPADSEFEIEDIFEFKVAAGAKAHMADFILEISSDLPVTYGVETEISVPIAPSGFFVWEGEKGAKDYSGEFIMNYLEDKGYDVVYSNIFPPNLAGFDAVFLSYANPGKSLDKGTPITSQQSLAIQDYLENGGKLYIEGASLFTGVVYLEFPNAEDIFSLFGVLEADANLEAPNLINKLSGIDGTINEGMVFKETNQKDNWYLNTMVPAEGAKVSFTEEYYGDVSIYNEGEYGQKTYYFSYALAELEDVDPQSSRYNFMVKMMGFFGYTDDEGQIVANFKVDKNEVDENVEVQFTDWSIADEGYEITSWAWDFNEDGQIDSYDQHPSWSFDKGGYFDITLIASGANDSDTLIRKDVVLVRSGILVYEGEENANCYSGSFIYNYLVNNWYDEVAYTNTWPADLSGYDAVFLSFGNTGLRSTEVTPYMSDAIDNFGKGGGYIYLEGGDVLSQELELTIIFGIEEVNNGDKNMLDGLIGQDGAITDGLQFNTSNQLSYSSIDSYSIFPDLPAIKVAFEESDYGTVAVEFDGTNVYGQKTFCMSYALADLVDGEGENTRNELLGRILNFFDVVADVEEIELDKAKHLSVFPNPAKDQITLQLEVIESGEAQIEVFDLSGRRVSLIQQNYNEGDQQVNFNISDLNTGVYYFRFQSGSQTETIKWIKVE